MVHDHRVEEWKENWILSEKISMRGEDFKAGK